MYQDLERNQQWIQIAIVQGAVRDCGDVDFPGLYIRLDESSIFDFIQSAINDSLVAETPSVKLRTTEVTAKDNIFKMVEHLFILKHEHYQASFLKVAIALKSFKVNNDKF